MKFALFTLLVILIVASVMLNCNMTEQNIIYLPYLKTNLTAFEPCPYMGESFFYAIWQAPDSVGGLKIEYRYSECMTDCEYDTEKIREKLINLMNQKVRLDREDYINRKDYIKDGICLRAWYEFPNSPDFVLLKYYHFVETRVMYLGYIKSSQELIFLDDIRNESLKENYNHMMESHPGILNLDPLCRAALIVSLTHGKGDISSIVILDSLSDMYPAMVTGQPHFDDEHYPFDPDHNDLYIFHILKHDNILEYADYIHKIHDFYDDVRIELKDTLATTKLSITPPKVIESSERTIVELVSFNSKCAHLAWWRIEFDGAGRLLKRQLVNSINVWYSGISYNPPRDAVLQQ